MQSRKNNEYKLRRCKKGGEVNLAIIKFTNSKAELKTIIGYVTRTDKTKAKFNK